jgi:hypothetical protein
VPSPGPNTPDAGGNLIGGGANGILNSDLAALGNNGGPTETHMPNAASPVLDRGSDTRMTDQRGEFGVVGAAVDMGSVERGEIDGDFNDDGVYDCLDIDALVAEIAVGTNGLAFDLTGDGLVDLADRDAWLAEAGEITLGPGKVYLLGDATLDGFVDALDFIEWNANKFTSVAEWCAGDFTADGIVDGLDFILWNDNKFQSSDGAAEVVLPRPNDRHDIDDTGRHQVYNDADMEALSVSPWVAPFVPKRVDSVFAMSRRAENHKDERPQADSFENFGDDLTTPRPLIVS